MSSARVAVVDYQAGNVTSVLKGLRAAGADPFVTSAAPDLRDAAGVVIPGVGHFAATAAIGRDVRAALLACATRKPILGICLGMQYLFDGSEEAPDVPGLGLLGGRCTRIPGPLKVPHVGWNELVAVKPSRLLADVPRGSHAYFTHSYAAPLTDATVAATEYGDRFAAVVERDNVFGVQFHPEKSSAAGLAILRAFMAIIRSPDCPIARSPDCGIPRC